MLLEAFPPWVSLLCATVLGYLLYRWLVTERTNLPPGPRGLPLLGYAPFLGPMVHQTYYNLGKRYGDVVRINVLGRNFIILNSYEAIRECFVHQGDEFAGRIETKDDAFWFLTDGTGVIREEGEVWREHRRFALHTMRDFGFGKLSMEARVQEIAKGLLSALEDTKGQPIDIMDLLANSTFNVILYLTMDKYFPADNPDFVMVRKNVKTFLGLGRSGAAVFILNQLTKFLPNRWRPGFAQIIPVKKEFEEFIARAVKEHEDNLDEENPKDYIDAHLAQRNKERAEGKDTTFTEQRLGSNIMNLLVAGTETTSNTLYWLLKIISHRPEIQKRIQKELDDVVGKERLPSILDRSSMPYTEAVILELHRFTSIAATGVPHTNPAPAKFRGYDIPARSLVFSNLWAVHNDPRLWTEPDKFDPDRFMDPETRNKRREYVIPFAIGKRACLGESLARMELFIFLTMLLQKFCFKPQEGDKGEITVAKTILRSLEPYKVCVLPRE